LDNLSEVSNKKAFVFSTSGQGKKGYNNSLEVKLKDKGFQIVGSVVCKGYDIFGSFFAPHSVGASGNMEIELFSRVTPFH